MPEYDYLTKERQLKESCQQGNLGDVIDLMSQCDFPNHIIKNMICVAVRRHHNRVADQLISTYHPNIDQTLNFNTLLLEAIEHKNVTMVERLIPLCNPKNDNSFALRAAVNHQHEEIVKLLIPVSDPASFSNEALQTAVEDGCVNLVKLLIPVSDFTENDGTSLQGAVINGNKEIVKLLIPFCDYNDVLQRVEHSIYSNQCTLLKQCIEEYEAELVEQQKQRLLQEINPIDTQKHNLSKRKI